MPAGRWLVAAWLLVEAGGVVLRTDGAHQLVAQADASAGAADLWAMKQRASAEWSEVVDDLWSTLFLQKVTNEPFDLVSADAKTKEGFLARCVETFDTLRTAVPDAVVRKKCGGAGGSAQECDAMVKGLWKAFDTRNAKISPPPLQAWCDKTFAWFADKTGPRCLDKCTALYCKPRCSLNKKYMDLRDQEVALKLRLDLSKKREERLDKTEGSLKEIADSISKFEAEKVQPALADLKAAQEAVDKIRGEMDKVGDAEKLRDAAEKASAEHKAALKAEGSSKALAAATEKAHGLEKDRNKQRLTVKNLEEQLKVVSSRLSQVKAQCAAQQAFTAKLLRSVIDEGTHLARLQGELRTAKERAESFNGTNVTRAADQASALRGALGELKAKLVTEQQMLYQTMGLYEDAKEQDKEKADAFAELDKSFQAFQKAHSGPEAQMREATKEMETKGKVLDAYNSTETFPLQVQVAKLDAVVTSLQDELKASQGVANSTHVVAAVAAGAANAANATNRTVDAEAAIKALQGRLALAGAEAERTRSRHARSSVQLSRLLGDYRQAEQRAAGLGAKLIRTRAEANDMRAQLAHLNSSHAGAQLEMRSLEQKQASTRESVAATGLAIAKAEDAQARAEAAERLAVQQLGVLQAAAAAKGREAGEAQAALGALEAEQAKGAEARLEDQDQAIPKEKCAGVTKKLKLTTKALEGDLSAAKELLGKSEAAFTEASAAAAKIETDLKKATSEAQTKADKAAASSKEISEAKSKLGGKLTKAQGTLTKTKMVAAAKQKTLKEMTDDHAKELKVFKQERTALQEKRKPLQDKLAKLEKELVPYEKALAPYKK